MAILYSVKFLKSDNKSENERQKNLVRHHKNLSNIDG